MTRDSDTTIADSVESYPSLAALREAHGALLEQRRADGETPELRTGAERLIRRGVATGALLDENADRRAAQSLLNYWANLLYRLDQQPLDATLAEFNPLLAPVLPDEACPYLGLDAFSEANAKRFFGRQELIARMLDRLREQRLLAVVGPSGSGKSSVVRAGLLPALRGGALPGSEGWRYLPAIVPGSDLFAALNQILRAANQEPRTENQEPLRPFDHAVPEPDEGQGRPGSVQARTENGHPQGQPRTNDADVAIGSPLVLVVDQFEEVFTLCEDGVNRQAFIEKLLALANAPEPQHRVVLTMRSDFETFVARLPELQPLFERGRVQATPLSAAELREAIEAPAAQVGLKFEQGVVDLLLQDILGEPAGLPLLQFTLLKLWQQRERNRVTRAAYERVGGGRRALARSADAFYQGLIPEEQVTARRILLRMVRPGEGLEITSNRVRRSALLEGGEDPGRVERVLGRLIHARLVRLTAGETAEDDQVEVAHEALVRNWPTLVDWLEQEKAAIATRRRLESRAAEWVRLGSGEAGLLDEVEWHEAERWLSSAEAAYLGYDETVLELVRASRAAQDEKVARQRRLARLRLGAASIIALLFLFMVALLAIASGQAKLTEQQRIAASTAQAFAVEQQNLAQAQATARAEAVVAQATAEAERQRAEQQTGFAKQQARLARVGQLVAQSQASVDLFPQRSLLLAVEALTTTMELGEPHTPAAEEALREALANASGYGLGGNQDPVYALSISSDNHWLVTSGVYSPARLWDLTAPDPTANSFVLPRAGGSAAISADNHWLVTGGYTPTLWDLTTRDPSANPIVLGGHTGDIDAVAFSPDSHWLVTGSGPTRIGQTGGAGHSDHTARLWNLTAKDPSANPIVLAGHDGAISAVAFSPDNHWLVTAGGEDFASNTVDKTARLWDLTSQDPSTNPIILRGHASAISAVAFSPDNHWLISAGGGRFGFQSDNTVRLWDLNKPAAAPIILRGHTDSVNAIAVSPDSRWLATASDDATTRLWQLTAKDPASSSTVLPGHNGPVRAVAFGPGNSQFVTGGADQTVRLWDLTDQGVVSTSIVLRGLEASVSAVAISPNGRWLAAASDSDRSNDKRHNTARIWDLAEWIGAAAPIALDGFVQGSTVAFSPNNHWLPTHVPDAVLLWDLSTGAPARNPTGLLDPGNHSAISPNGRWLVTFENTIAHVWDLSAGNLRPRSIALRDPNLAIETAAISENARWLLTDSSDNPIRVWDLSTNDPSASPIVLPGSSEIHVFSPDNRWLVTGDYNQTQLWDLTAHAPAANPIITQRGGDDIAFNSDSSLLATTDFDTIRLWNLTLNDPSANFVTLHLDNEYITSIAFSPDKHWLATGISDNTVRLWDLSTKDLTISPIILRGHEDHVRVLAFSSDGRWLATGSEDKTARLWDLTADGSLGISVVLHKQESAIKAIGFSPDGHWLATNSRNGPLTLWSLHIDELVALACRTAGRNLTWAEWQQYLGQEPYRKTCPTLPIDPNLVQAGSDLARAGNIDRATTILRRALELDPSLNIDPEKEARRLAAQGLMEQARNLAESGSLQSAITQLQKAKEFDPSLDITPETEALQYMAQGLADKGANLARQGHIKEAITAFAEAQKLAPDLYTDAWDTLCWYGSLAGKAADVLDACERAVKQPPDSRARDSRGLARALTGNYMGAIEDFVAFVEWARQQGIYDEQARKREDWIRDLKAGRNPFDHATLDALQNEWK